nr:hypothetical protein [Tanacetum cinerariifolium]
VDAGTALEQLRLDAGFVGGDGLGVGHVVAAAADVFVEVVDAGLPVERTRVLRFDAEFLGVLLQVVQHAGGLHLEGHAGLAGHAAVDVAAAV